MKKLLSFSLAMIMLLTSLVSCNGDDTKGAKMLSFAQANSLEEMEALNGQKVSIIGYMSTLSPVSGKFMYLMNLPYQSCPFCVPNTTQLSNTIAVYAKDGQEFDFTYRAIQVTGIMEFGDYTDEFEYEYSYRIKDATFEVLDTSNMSEQLKLWQQLASSDVISEIYTSFEYINFLCYWPTYTANFDSGKDYLWPENALYYIETDGAQFNFGFKEGYFDNIIATIKSVDEEAFAELIEIVEEAKALSDKAYSELKEGKYSMVPEYSTRYDSNTGKYNPVFGDGREQYKMDNIKDFEEDMERIFGGFSTWLAEWEL